MVNIESPSCIPAYIFLVAILLLAIPVGTLHPLGLGAFELVVATSSTTPKTSSTSNSCCRLTATRTSNFHIKIHGGPAALWMTRPPTFTSAFTQKSTQHGSWLRRRVPVAGGSGPVRLRDSRRWYVYTKSRNTRVAHN
jgi:hypothetical protein